MAAAAVFTFYTRCLDEVPKMKVTDVHRLVKAISKAPTSLLDKGFRLYVSTYIFNYEGKTRSFFELYLKCTVILQIC